MASITHSQNTQMMADTSPSSRPTEYSCLSMPRSDSQSEEAEKHIFNDTGEWAGLPDGVTHLTLKKTPVKWDELKETITVLNVNESNLTDIPEGLFLYTFRLKVLDFSHNRIKRIGHTISGFASTLVKLDLEDNQITEIPDSLYKLKRLEFLNLSDNKIKTLSEGIMQMPALNDVKITGNKDIMLTQQLIEYFNAKAWTMPKSIKLKVDRRQTIRKSNSLFSFFGMVQK